MREKVVDFVIPAMKNFCLTCVWVMYNTYGIKGKD
jgi:hypothetical protein